MYILYFKGFWKQNHLNAIKLSLLSFHSFVIFFPLRCKDHKLHFIKFNTNVQITIANFSHLYISPF